MGAERVFDYFYDLSGIERLSSKEKDAADYLVKTGRKMGLQVYRDSENNVILKDSRREGTAPAVILQAHTDMVWEAEEFFGSDCSGKKVPRGIRIEDGVMYADRTTLGADDGIGVAMILALLEGEGKGYPPLEAVFTSNEEETMDGAAALRTEDLTGKYLINLDSEKEGVITVGAAGGISSFLRFPVVRQPSALNRTVKVTVSGGLGGHSGLEIGKKRENAVKLLVRFLQTLDKREFELCSLCGGNRANAIPSEAEARINITDEKEREAVAEAISTFMKECKGEWQEEAMLNLSVEETKFMPSVMETGCRDRLLLLLESLPHGVREMSDEFVCSSVNLALVRDGEREVQIELSLRSSYESWYRHEVQRIARLALALGADAKSGDEYPAWPWQKQSSLFRVMSEAYEELYKKKPAYENVHAGVECGLIMERCPSIREAVSIGPTILNAHTTSEQLMVETVGQVYALLDCTLKKLGEKDGKK